MPALAHGYGKVGRNARPVISEETDVVATRGSSLVPNGYLSHVMNRCREAEVLSRGSASSQRMDRSRQDGFRRLVRGAVAVRAILLTATLPSRKGISHTPSGDHAMNEATRLLLVAIARANVDRQDRQGSGNRHRAIAKEEHVAPETHFRRSPISAPAEARGIRGSARHAARSPNSTNAWLGREDSNLRMAESKSAALPLGYAPTRRTTDLARRKAARTIVRGVPRRNGWPPILRSSDRVSTVLAGQECLEIGIGAADQNADPLVRPPADRRRS